ncbi:MAG: pantoate--beta-alanine ligase [Bacteroidales bacterium]|nr:pantoate--beta-alanine ligase [Bacteroidales bacterium]
MEIIRSFLRMQEKTASIKNAGQTIGFVPTMGALHLGHLALLEQSKTENDFSVVSIFVNPTQFNNPEDLINYPRTIDSDLEKLETAGCDFVFLPSVDEMYPTEVVSEKWNFGFLEMVMEGKNRPGHFQGVATVVKRLFEAVPSHKAYFGMKDYQQLLIIKEMVKQLGLDIKIVPVSIVREADGLAMSSRNLRLSAKNRQIAPHIYQTIKQVVTLAKQLSVEELKQFVNEQINQKPPMVLEYFELADGADLQPVTNIVDHQSVMAFIVVDLGGVRLIDNISIF